MIAEQLKRSILQAAIQGKLTEQLPEDGDARDLLKEIQKERARLIKEGKITKEKPVSEISEDEIPFEIPENWCWIRLGDLCSKIGAGSTPSGGRATYVAHGIKFIRSQNVHNAGLRIENVSYITEDVHNQRPSSWVQSRDLLLNITGASIGRCALVPDNFDTANINQHVLILRPIDEKIRFYIHSVVTSPYIYDEIMRVQVGGTKEGLSAEKAKYLLIPFPPLAEQNRIFERLDRLLPEIDKLKNDETKLDELQKFFPKKMKDSILQYAIQGKLTEQIPEDGDARDLLKEIQKEKARLVKEGKIKKEKPLPEISEYEIPFDIPENWCWVRLGDIFYLTMGQSPDGNSVIEGDKGIEFHQGKVFFGEDYIQKSSQSTNKPTKIVEPNSVLLCVRAPVGIVNITERKICIGRGLCGINTLAEMNEKFVLHTLRVFKNDFIKKATGTTFVAITGEVVKNQLIPLPPIAEQKRIVQRLEELLPLCETLE